MASQQVQQKGRGPRNVIVAVRTAGRPQLFAHGGAGSGVGLVLLRSMDRQYTHRGRSVKPCARAIVY